MLRNFYCYRGGKRILAFRGIQHVLPPLGELRFRAPVPLKKWDGIKEAKHNGHICPQHLATKVGYISLSIKYTNVLYY